jgi:hypothetical protein
MIRDGRGKSSQVGTAFANKGFSKMSHPYYFILRKGGLPDHNYIIFKMKK